MKISRRGSSADHGSRSIRINKPTIKWNKKLGVVQFRQSRIGDFATDSTHDYTIEISLSEISKIIEIVGGELVNEVPDTISEEFSPCLRELIRIKKACIGNVGTPQDSGVD